MQMLRQIYLQGGADAVRQRLQPSGMPDEMIEQLLALFGAAGDADEGDA